MINPQKSVVCICPKCNTKKAIAVPIDIMNKEKLTTIYLPKKLICEHSFEAHIDINFVVRGYTAVDFEFTVPQPTDELDQVVGKIDLEKIKQSVKISTIATVLYGAFRGKKVLIIIDYYMKEIKEQILQYFSYVFTDSFNFYINLMTREEYDQEKNSYKDYIIVERNKIIRPKKFKESSIRSEKKIVQKFFIHEDLKDFIIASRNEIKKIYTFCEAIKELEDQKGEKAHFTTQEIKDHLVNKYQVKLKVADIWHLIAILKNYFSVELYIREDAQISLDSRGFGGML